MSSIQEALAGIDVGGAWAEQCWKTMEWRAFAERAKHAAGYTCRFCRRAKETVRLNVHHHAYEKGRMPWDYTLAEVSVLCWECHEAMHAQLQAFRRVVFSKLSPNEFRVLNGALAVGCDEYDRTKLVYAIASLVSSPGAVERFAKEWRPTVIGKILEAVNGSSSADED